MGAVVMCPLIILSSVAVIGDFAMGRATLPELTLRLLGTTLLTLTTAASYWIGAGLRRLSPGVRNWAIAISSIGLLAVPFGTIISGYILWRVAGRTGKYLFSDEYNGVIAATPHLRYKTSVWMLCLIALLIFVTLMVFVAFMASVSPD